jgi:hypothetical protein
LLVVLIAEEIAARVFALFETKLKEAAERTVEEIAARVFCCPRLQPTAKEAAELLLVVLATEGAGRGVCLVFLDVWEHIIWTSCGLCFEKEKGA